jgi:hypothetical protein
VINSVLQRHSATKLWVLFVASRAVVLLFLVGRVSDLGWYVEWAGDINAGLIPFRDFFPGYPPLAMMWIGLPGIFASEPAVYFAIFRLLCCAIDCGVFMLVLRRADAQPARILLYIIGTTALGPMLYDRLDIVLGGLLVVVVISLLSDLHRLSHLALGIGIAFKFLPIVLAPVMLAFESRKGHRRFARCLLLMTLPTLLSFGASAARGGYHFGPLFDFHARRGIQLESVPATVEMVLIWGGVSSSMSHDYMCYDLHTAYENGLVLACTALLVAVVLGGGVMAMRRGTTVEALTLLLGAILCASLALSKVLSASYFIFLLPVLVVLPVPRGKTEAAAVWYLVLAMTFLTGIIFPWGYRSLVGLKPTAEVALMLRNACLGVLSVHLFIRAWRDSAPLTSNT